MKNLLKLFNTLLVTALYISLVPAQSGPPETPTSANCTPSTLYFDQLVDHNDSSSSNTNITFKQQYQLIDRFFTPGGPILFYQGGETAQMLCLEELVLPYWASGTSALMVVLEHRFFGASLPSNVQNLTERYASLTLNNVLADSVAFVQWIKSTIPGAKNSSVIAVGSSYSAFLSTILRTSYPEIFHGAICQGAPVHGLGYGDSNNSSGSSTNTSNNSNIGTCSTSTSSSDTDNGSGWFIWLNQVYQDASLSASLKIKTALAETFSNLRNASYFAHLSATLNTCTPFNTTTSNPTLQINTLYSLILSTFEQNAQYSWAPGSPFLVQRHKSGNSLPRLISTLESTNTSTVAAVLNASVQIWNEGASCLDTTGSSGNGGGYVTNDDSPYNYLLCTFFPLNAQYSPANATIFPPLGPETTAQATAHCQALFGTAVPPLATQADLWAKYHFAPHDLRTTKRLLYSSGGYDPVSAYAPLYLFDMMTTGQTDRNASRMLVVQEMAHVEDLFAPYAGMKEAVRWVQNVELQILKGWLGLM